MWKCEQAGTSNSFWTVKSSKKSNSPNTKNVVSPEFRSKDLMKIDSTLEFSSVFLRPKIKKHV